MVPCFLEFLVHVLQPILRQVRAADASRWGGPTVSHLFCAPTSKDFTKGCLVLLEDMKQSTFAPPLEVFGRDFLILGSLQGPT